MKCVFFYLIYVERLFLIDSSALAFRMFYAYARNPLRNSKGQPVSLLHGYWGSILRILKVHKPSHFAIVRDVNKKTFRHKLYSEYKATRSPMPNEMAEQLPFLNESLIKSGIPILEQEGFEADDVMASVAKLAAEKGLAVFIVSKDKDMAQVVNEKIHLYQIEKGASGIEVGVEQVKAKFGVNPEQIIDYLALMGDSSDNIPGVTGIGPKGAAEMLTKYGTLENIYEKLAELPKTKRTILETGRENAFLSKELVTLKSEHDFGYKLENLRYEGLKRNDLFNLFTEYEVPSLIQLLPSKGDVPSLFSMLPEVVKEKKISVNTVEDLQKMENIFTSAKTLAFSMADTGAISVSKNETDYYELSQDTTLYKEWLKDILENENLELVFFNAKAFFHANGMPRGTIRDALLAQWLLRPSSVHHSTAPANAALLMARWNKTKDELKSKNMFEFFESKETPLLKCLYSMEIDGIALDNSVIANLNLEFQKKAADLETQIYEIADEQFNLASTKQLSQILYEKLKLPVLKKNASGPSTDAETLEMLLEQNEPHPILEPIMSYREFKKLQTTYTEALPKLVSQKTNRIHTTFLPWGTATGRLSSVNPNLQNIPVRREDGKRIRAAFVPRENWKLISADYSQIELRLLAHLSGDKELSNAFLNNLDIHSITAVKIFGTEEVSKEMRAAAKIVNFGVIYGMSAFKLARDLHISRSKAMEFISGYFNLYSKVKEYFETVISFARQNGFIETISKRRRYLPELGASDHQERATAERMAMNSPIQGSAADLITEAMLRLHSRIKNENLPLKMLLQVHDELVFECEASRAEEFSAMIKNEMENAMPLNVPVAVNVGVGNNWLEAHF